MESHKTKQSIGLFRLDELIKEADFVSQAMSYACLEICQQNKELGDKMVEVLRTKLKPISAEDYPAEADFKSDIVPAVKWLVFLGGFRTGCCGLFGASEDGRTGQAEETKYDQAKKDNRKLNPSLGIVRKWLSTLTYREKLAIALSWQLLNKEDEFINTAHRDRCYEDDKVGNELLQQCTQAVTAANQDDDYVKMADSLELAVTAFTSALLPIRA